MSRCASIWIALCLPLLLTGCELFQPRTVSVPVMLTPQVPPRLLTPLPAPTLKIETPRGVLELLADYEALRRRANADRNAVAEILSHDPEPAP